MYWEVGSTNAYFAFHLIKPILERTGAKLIIHPFNLGDVFSANNYVLMDGPTCFRSTRIVIISIALNRGLK